MQNLQENQRQSGKSAENNRQEQGNNRESTLGGKKIAITNPQRKIMQHRSHGGGSSSRMRQKRPTQPRLAPTRRAKNPGAISAPGLLRARFCKITLYGTSRVTKQAKSLERNLWNRNFWNYSTSNCLAATIQSDPLPSTISAR